MAVVTRLQAQKNQQRVNLFLDDRFAFGLPLELVLSASLKVGRQLSEAEVDRLKKQSFLEKNYSAALRFLSFRPRSLWEMKRYLASREESEEGIKEIISRLSGQKLLDDQAFVRWWCRQRLDFRPRSRNFLLAELAKKGIPRALAAPLVAEMVNEVPLAAALLLKKFPPVALPTFAQKTKLAAFLARRGFSWEVINQAVDSWRQKS